MALLAPVKDARSDPEFVINEELKSCLFIQKFAFFQKSIILHAWKSIFLNKDEINMSDLLEESL